MLCVRAPVLEKRLLDLSNVTGKSKSHYVRLAILMFLEQIPSDEEPGKIGRIPSGVPQMFPESNLLDKTGREAISL